ncbi:histidine phosphatase family protein [Phenylobacterium aquaticum]|uniref:histidine phosphatase family protein n=1 Tax=Phenylobacterium aquaticum TaxID=1763816 RepID=UPI001F5D09C4|nr:histidine phosphatase family protein [Phenylobacterium aquaticum]MCI3135498.1 histidine phosphatase family protein [Phenylobacterium aquaticum]
MTKLILTRHGHVEGIVPERFRGRMELALTEAGQEDARRTAAFIARTWTPAAVYASPMQRCQKTAAEIARACGGLEVQTAEGLNDLDYGGWQWRTHEEVAAAEPEAYRLWKQAPQLVRFPQGESLQDLVGHTADALREVLARHPDKSVVLVGHDSVNRALLLQLLDQPLSAYGRLSQDPCGVSEVDIEHGQAKVRRINEIGHLAR